MSEQDDRILEREMAKWGKLGGLLGGGEASAGGLGAKLAAKLMPTREHTVQVVLPATAQQVLHSAWNMLEHDEDVYKQGPPAVEQLPAKIYGIFCAGWLNMTPAVLHVEVLAHDGRQAWVRIRGAAKEGWIPQRVAEKAVAKLVKALNSEFAAGQFPQQQFGQQQVIPQQTVPQPTLPQQLLPPAPHFVPAAEILPAPPRDSQSRTMPPALPFHRKTG